MHQTDIGPQVEAAYEIIAKQHAEGAFGGVYTEYYERPAMRALLGDVEGQRVLDAGCGRGDNTEWLLAHRASSVIAIDSSPAMVALTRERVGTAADVWQADLNEPLECKSASLDTILCSLVLDYIRDWDPTLKEFGRILKVGGQLCFSVHHPFFLDLKVEADVHASYFAVQRLEEDWSPLGLSIPAYRRPLGAICSALWEGGFVIELIVEPTPIEACKRDYPEHYERLSKHPVFILFRARKRGR
jgi:SAM-dependent methyltransferase